ncbi:hypothetical protein HK103_004936 [Boothiomyces macroporosus]|uniref:Uncharacterized protein n=1 Tax=Boothiomyces macroporosus TaxID=261099 RepID=A0AAD5UFY4_9FUNG|nr:hypothetical protein HK103_004936 [Boothiomyces macroporosus]
MGKGDYDVPPPYTASSSYSVVDSHRCHFSCPNCHCEWYLKSQSNPKAVENKFFGRKVYNFIVRKPFETDTIEEGVKCKNCSYKLRALDLKNYIPPELD